jgi:hypothetical protein
MNSVENTLEPGRFLVHDLAGTAIEKTKVLMQEISSLIVPGEFKDFYFDVEFPTKFLMYLI